jgi:hypothetical protein
LVGKPVGVSSGRGTKAQGAKGDAMAHFAKADSETLAKNIIELCKNLPSETDASADANPSQRELCEVTIQLDMQF